MQEKVSLAYVILLPYKCVESLSTSSYISDKKNNHKCLVSIDFVFNTVLD